MLVRGWPLKAAISNGVAWKRLASSQRIRPPAVTKGLVSEYRPVYDTIDCPEYWRTGRPKTSPNHVVIYRADEIPKLRNAARLARKILEFSLALAKPGITTDEIDRLAHEEMLEHNAYPSPLNYMGFPKSICTSVNNVACHGIPDSYVLRDGDTISIDVSLFLDGVHGDNCGATTVGTPDPEQVRLIAATREAVDKAIAVCGPGRLVQLLELFCH